MKESSGPKKARRSGECHVLVRILWSREGIVEPQRRLFLPDESLELRIQDSVIGPRAAQCTSETVLLRRRSWRLEGRLRLLIVSRRVKGGRLAAY
jgi:hypothetical protein